MTMYPRPSARYPSKSQLQLRRFRSVGIVLCTSFLVAQSAYSLETLEGTITAAGTAQPLVGIDLDVFDEAGASVSIGAVVTDAAGHYVVPLPGPGTYLVRADPGRSDGVAAQYYSSVHLKSLATPVVVGTGQVLTGIDFVLPPGVLISGHASFAGLSLAGIDIDVFDLTGEFLGAYPGTSDASGNYVVGALPAGSYFVEADPVKSSLLVPEFVGGAYEIDSASALLVAGSDVVGADIDLDLGGTIAGSITSALDGSPVAAIDIDVFDLTGTKLSPNAGSDGGGVYDIGVLPPGQFYVKADPSAVQGFAARFYDEQIDLELADAVTVLPGTTTNSIDFSLQPAGSVTGTIRDEFGTPIAGIDLDLFDPVTATKLAPNAASGADGSYQLDGLSPGIYHVRADPTLGQGYARTYYLSSSILAGASPVTVLGGPATAGIDFALGQGAGISGTVLDLDTGTPIAGARLQFADAIALIAMDQKDSTTSNGSFSVGAFPPGDYLVLAVPPSGDLAHVATWYDGTTDVASATPLTLTGGSVLSNVTIALPEPNGLLVGLLGLLLLSSWRKRRRGPTG